MRKIHRDLPLTEHRECDEKATGRRHFWRRTKFENDRWHRWIDDWRITDVTNFSELTERAFVGQRFCDQTGANGPTASCLYRRCTCRSTFSSARPKTATWAARPSCSPTAPLFLFSFPRPVERFQSVSSRHRQFLISCANSKHTARRK